tara:strand:+ start:635 stop:1030 length:396 start_codon:yes stop_codon:yes gene_type:complete
MNTSTKMIIGLGLIAALVFYQVNSQLPKNGMSNDEINATIVDMKDAFDKAEQSVLGVDPNPVTPKVPDPDPAKCICQGTGEIVQGDGHITQCPYHGSKGVLVEPTTQYFKPEARKYVFPRRNGLLQRLFFN